MILRATGSLSEAIVLLVPGARVVKAFNTVFASRLNDPVLDGVPLDGFYAGDDAGAKQVVAELLARMGFRPIDTGELLTARALELADQVPELTVAATVDGRVEGHRQVAGRAHLRAEPAPR